MREQSAPARPRLNWFCSLPQGHNDSASSVLATLIALARHARMTVWTDRWYPAIDLGDCVKRRWDGRAWVAVNSADATVYHAAEDGTLPDWIRDVARLHAGVLVVDELSPPDSRPAETSPAEHLRLTALHLARARGIIVHTDAAFGEASALDRCPVIQLEYGDPDADALELIAAVTRLQQNPSSVLHALCSTTGRILSETRMDPSAQRYVAERAAQEVCRWTASP
jgi:hypothetical protein